MTESPELNGIFTRIRDNLDAHYDRRERLIKISRDITAQSKKMIFALQRIQGEVSTLPPAIQKQIDTQEGEIKKLLARAEKDIQGPNAYRYVARAGGGLTVNRYHRQISPGIQEYVWIPAPCWDLDGRVMK